MGIVRLPPLVLHAVHQRAAPGSGAHVHTLKMPSVHSTPTDYDSLAVTALLHRLRAAAIAGQPTIMLSELLGVPLAGIKDVELDVPGKFDLGILDHRIDVSNFAEHRRSTLEKAHWAPKTTCIAFVNATGARFADAFVIFPQLVIFVQEKQSLEARQQKARGGVVPAMPAHDAAAEYEKVKDVATPHVFLYVTDCDARDAAAVDLPANTTIGPNGLLNKLLGGILARLRAEATLDSATRGKSAAAAAASHAPAAASAHEAPSH